MSDTLKKMLGLELNHGEVHDSCQFKKEWPYQPTDFEGQELLQNVPYFVNLLCFLTCKYLTLL